MAEYVNRYDVGSLESTERSYSDLALMRRIVFDYMLRHRALFALEIALILAKMVTILAGPYIYKITIDFFINDTPTVDGRWLTHRADVPKGTRANRQSRRNTGSDQTPWLG